jgi:hypothetical protein
MTIRAQAQIVAMVAAMLVAGGVPAAQNSNVTVPDLLERVATYLGVFEKEYARLIADERYKQTLKQKRVQRLSDRTQTETREIKSDIVAAPESGSRWLSFRDVYSVNGAPVRDRDSRLEKLFASAGENRFVEARRILAEGARFNLGTIFRTINQPSMPLMFIASENRSRSAFRAGRKDTVAGVETVVIDFEETARPTLVKSSTRSLPATGSFWVEPNTGRVMKASVKIESNVVTMEMLVTFGFVEKLNMWVPVEMTDVASNALETVMGFAVYTNYRRFDTSVVIK